MSETIRDPGRRQPAAAQPAALAGDPPPGGSALRAEHGGRGGESVAGFAGHAADGAEGSAQGDPGGLGGHQPGGRGGGRTGTCGRSTAGGTTFVTQPMRIPLGKGMSGYVVANDEVLVTGDLSGDPRLAVPEFADEGVQAMALVPMHARGRVVGILSVMNHQPYRVRRRRDQRAAGHRRSGGGGAGQRPPLRKRQRAVQPPGSDPQLDGRRHHRHRQSRQDQPGQRHGGAPLRPAPRRPAAACRCARLRCTPSCGRACAGP
ncbi:MAG: hypothetical protein KatS3mg051_0438 [Anaerolineae bacterium]|nr:MAG: hypothetical protein KatS3mg051_0438 [Anaerolineae bacterium]